MESEDLTLHEGDQCIVEGDRCLEFGRVTQEVQDMDSGVGNDLPRILRRATLQDQAQAKESHVRSNMAAETCRKKAETHELKMRFVSVRFSFDRSRLLVTFTADDRVDFRELVKELVGELRTRVEMRQIGVRDEAGMVGGLGPCGRRMCCCSWLEKFESVNVRMAKEQHLSLNPGAISGMCGRLKCCLRYEVDCYRELNQAVPGQGARVICADGEGQVLDRDLLRQRLKIQLDDERIVVYPASEVEVRWTRKHGGHRGRRETTS
jgi:cell fate regulator YaaT (PSP1 superfamily)